MGKIACFGIEDDFPSGGTLLEPGQKFGGNDALAVVREYSKFRCALAEWRKAFV